MKIKKTYIVGVSAFVSIVLAVFMLQEILRLLSTQSITILIIPAVFIISTVYVFNYFRDYAFKSKIADEAAREASDGDWKKEQEIKKHLMNKIANESYTLKI